jgi:RNA polymerase sigma factor (sigma-70 family)
MNDNEALLLSNIGVVRKAAQSSLPPRMELEDWISELTLKVWQKIHRYDAAKGRFTTWVYAVAFRFANTVCAANNAEKRNNGHKTTSIHALTGNDGPGSLTRELPDPRLETAEDIDRRLDIADAVDSMIQSDQDYIASVMGGARDSEYMREHAISRQRVCYLRRRSLSRLHKALTTIGYNSRSK